MSQIKVNGYVLPNETLIEWKQRLVPAYDIFFFKNQPDFMACKEIKADTRLSFSLNDKTSFTTWAISNEAKYYISISNEEFMELTEEQKKQIIKEQWKMGRGLILTEENLITLLPTETREVLEILEYSSYEDKEQNGKVYMIQKFLWDMLSNETRTQFLSNYAKMWTDETALFDQLSENDQSLIRKEFRTLSTFIDTFSSKNGPNCLAAAAAALTGDISVIGEWMKPERFYSLMEDNQYRKINRTNLKKLDVLVWKNKQGQAVHASTLLNSKYCFNKHGQTMFNPWQVLKVEDVMESWGREFQIEIYRKH
ncbi:hypothetical protein ACOJQI_09930 [Bacillus salacetis]|uniref:hypothetical protein n=1 Tax=Bacillus salacetis TaxID=2315464 RepID=UPI003B9F0992